MIRAAKTIYERHYGEECQQSAEERAEGIIGAEPKRRGWTEGDLRARRKGDQLKVRLAKRLPAETAVTVNWIANRLCMGTRGRVTQLLYWPTLKKPPKD